MSDPLELHERRQTREAPGLDDLFRTLAARKADADALIDPPDRARIDGQVPRRFTYAAAERVVGGIAARLHEVGLPAGTVVGVQLPNTCESILTLLGVIRAGMIPAPLPLLWRRAECVTALSRAGARAIVTCGRVGDTDHAQLALEIAAELFPIRTVCGFGCGGLDGIVPLGDLLAASAAPALNVDGTVASTAVITFDMQTDGPVPVPRSHAQLVAAGWLIRDRAGIQDGEAILSTMPAASFAGLATGMLPWLLTGGSLTLHHPFEPEVLAAQIAEQDRGTLVIPEMIMSRLCDAGLVSEGGPRAVIALWRSPERFVAAPSWPAAAHARLIDVAAFGETGLLAAARPGDGKPGPWPAGAVSLEQDGRWLELARVAQLPSGTLGFGGVLAAAPARLYDLPGEETQEPGTTLYDTGYSCRADEAGLVVTGAPAGLVNVGGYRFTVRDLQARIHEIDSDAVLAALPHALCGHRLAGHAANSAEMRKALHAAGTSPLVGNAFADRLPPSA